MNTSITTFGALKASGYISKSIKNELRDNLIVSIQEGKNTKDNWKINYKLLTENDIKNNLQNNCNVIIEFYPMPSEENELYRVLGVTYSNDSGLKLIKIYLKNNFLYNII